MVQNRFPQKSVTKEYGNITVCGCEYRPLVGRACPLANTPLTHVGYRARLDCCWSDGTGVRIGTSAGNGDARLRAFKSVKVIGTGIDRSATYDFLFAVHSNSGPVFYCFQDAARYCPKLRYYPTPVYLMPPPRRVHFWFCNAGWVQKPEWRIPGWEKAGWYL